ncbi:MAG: pantoate--beta-alanine ligase [Pirellulales bacterium]|nr:pantoate--beta-alanine ligase [Pirellulales bacterium]
MSLHEAATTRLVTTAQQTRAAVLASRAKGESVGFVPTMGALHRGHLSLVKASLAECDRTVVSIFVNPTQFDPSEDLDRYPRTLDEDMRQLEALGCWLVFAPTREEMYREDYETYVEVGEVARPWEGASRPNHFRGVATVVLKLFHIVPADRAYFGQKDYQQTLVVKQLVRDLSVPIEICVQPTVREADGLALSSRNTYLSPDQRRQACCLWQALQLAERLHAAGEKSAEVILSQMKQQLATAHDIEVDYLAILKEGTVRQVSQVTGPVVVVVAAHVGETRLIDNHVIGKDE